MKLTRLLLTYEFKFFKRYVDHEMNKDWLRRSWDRFAGWKELKKRHWYFGEHRPWTEEFKRENGPFSNKRTPPIEPIKEWKFFKGDRVEIQVGLDKGKQGIINSIIKERNWCFVEGLNCEYKMIRQSSHEPPSCMKDERPLLVTSQVKLVDPSDEKPTEVDWRFTEKGERVRVSTRTGRIIPLPDSAKETEEFVLPKTYIESDIDTKDAQVKNVTFQPRAQSFDDEIMESFGIKETRKRGKTYWY